MYKTHLVRSRKAVEQLLMLRCNCSIKYTIINLPAVLPLRSKPARLQPFKSY